MVGHGDEVRHRHSGRFQFAAHHPEGERCPVDRQSGAPLGKGPQQVRQAPDVVLVGMGDDASLQVVGTLQ